MTKSLGDKTTIDGVQKSIWSNIISASSSIKPTSRFYEESSPPPRAPGSVLGGVKDEYR